MSPKPPGFSTIGPILIPDAKKKSFQDKCKELGIGMGDRIEHYIDEDITPQPDKKEEE
jgi:hypothetical protein